VVEEKKQKGGEGSYRSRKRYSKSPKHRRLRTGPVARKVSSGESGKKEELEKEGKNLKQKS